MSKSSKADATMSTLSGASARGEVVGTIAGGGRDGKAIAGAARNGKPAPRVAAGAGALAALSKDRPMTSFVESCLETVAGSASAAERQSRGRPRVRKLLKILADKKNILITTHRHPDPDALASSQALATLLQAKLPEAHVSVSVKGQVGGGINEGFVKASNLKFIPWDDEGLARFDAILLLDCQPSFAYSPLPAGVTPTAVIDHHRGRGAKPTCAFCDIRPEVGATGSLIFSYFMELEVPISADLAAALLYAIESDLAGAAGTPGDLDNVALSNLTLVANTRKLYQMRYVDLPQGYYVAYASAIANAVYFDNAIISHLESIETLEMPAVMADFLLRFDQVQFALVTAVYDEKLIISLRTSSAKISAADMIRRLLKNVGQGGGHRTKAGGYMTLDTASPTEIERKRNVLKRRYLRALGIKQTHGKRLTTRADGAEKK